MIDKTKSSTADLRRLTQMSEKTKPRKCLVSPTSAFICDHLRLKLPRGFIETVETVSVFCAREITQLKLEAGGCGCGLPRANAVMKMLACFVLLFTLGTAVQGQISGAKLDNPDRLFFRNGDSLSGTLQTIAPDGVRWVRSDAREAMEFASTNLSRVEFAPRPAPADAEVADCRVYLSNGDLLEGAFLSCDLTDVRVRTSYAGALDIPRAAVKSVVFLPSAQSAIFEGPHGLDGWVQGKSTLAAAVVEPGEWKYRNGAFYATKSASIARDVKLPDSVRIEFDLRWQDRFQLAVALFTDSLQPVSLAAKENEPDFGGFYSFQLNNSYADIIAITKREPLRYLEPVFTPLLLQTNRTHVDLRANKKTRAIALFLDGVLVKKWTDTNGFAGQGTGLRFVNQAQGAVKVSHVRVSAWDGRLDDKPSLTPDGKNDAILKADGSVAVGSVQSITNGVLALNIVQVRLAIPLAKVTRLDFAVLPETKPSAASASQVRVFAGQSSRLSLQLGQWDSNAVSGVSSLLGKVTLRPETLTRLEW